jgi:hypothetical protein
MFYRPVSAVADETSYHANVFTVVCDVACTARIGTVGSRFMAETHVEAYRGIDGADVDAVAVVEAVYESDDRGEPVEVSTDTTGGHHSRTTPIASDRSASRSA